MNIDGKGDPRPKKLAPPIFSTDLEKGSSEGSLNESLPINEDLEIEYLNKTFEMKDFLIYLKDQIVTDPKDRELSMKDIGAQGLEVIDSLLKYYEQGKVILLTKKIENDSKILPRKEKETLAEYNQRVKDQKNLNKDAYQKDIDDLQIKIDQVEKDFNIFNEILKKELINEYFFEKGIKQVVIHGDRNDYINQDNKKEDSLDSQIDLDVWSAMQIIEMGGVKLAEGFNVTWVDPKEKIQYDEDGKPYYNSVESVAIIDKNGKFEKDSKDNIKHERKISRLYLEPGTVILDVGNSFGVDIIAKDVIRINHHGEKNKKITSTTNELFNVVKENPKFIENFKENTGTSDFVWFENYINFVTKVDNLDYEVNPENWDNYNNTLYAGQKYFNSSNREIILDIFKNYPDIHFENFTQEEQDYIIAIGNKGQENNKKTGIKKISLKDLRPLRVDGKPFPPEFFEDHPLALYDSNIIKLRDLVELQKNAIRIANKVIKDNETVMYSNGLKTDSSVLGKVIIDEKDIQNKYNNPLGAVAAYGNGYDTYIILNLSGKRKNEVFVSTKKDATEFVDNLRTLFKETLGDAYTEETIIPVRDSMVVIRDPAVKSLDTDVIRAIIAKALRIDGHSKEKVMEDLKKKIETLINTDKRKDHIDKIETMLNRYNLNLK